MIPDNIQDLHLHIDNFKSNIEKEFAFLKEATSKNVENFQSSLNLQQTYSTALFSHVNSIYNKLVEIQQQLPHPNPLMNTGDVIQIEAPDFDPDIDKVLTTVEAADPIMVKAVTNNFEGSYNKIEATALSIVNVSFKIIAIREAHHNKIVRNTAIIINPISREIM